MILDRDDQVLAKAKVPCTPDITGGITAALDAVVRAPGVAASQITHVMLGTTHATNAVLERRRLRRVAVIRIGGPATHGVRPMFGWPRDLAEAVSIGATIVDGGTGQNAVVQVERFREVAGTTGLIVTKLDGTAKGGIVLQLSERFDLPIRYVGVGESLDDLLPFDKEDFVGSLLPEA